MRILHLVCGCVYNFLVSAYTTPCVWLRILRLSHIPHLRGVRVLVLVGVGVLGLGMGMLKSTDVIFNNIKLGKIHQKNFRKKKRPQLSLCHGTTL